MPRRAKSIELLDFEIVFYERLVRAYPDFVDVLIPLANAYTRRGNHHQGLAIDVRLTELRSSDPLTWYNLACSYSLMNRVEESLGAIKRCFELGYHDFQFLSKDPDLANLRRSPKFRPLLETLTSTHRA